MTEKVYGVYRNSGSGQTSPLHYAARIAEFLNRKDKEINYEVVGDDNHASVSCSSSSTSSSSRSYAEVEREMRIGMRILP